MVFNPIEIYVIPSLLAGLGIVAGFKSRIPILVAVSGIVLLLVAVIIATQGVSFKTGETKNVSGNETTTTFTYTELDITNSTFVQVIFYALLVSGFIALIFGFKEGAG